MQIEGRFVGNFAKNARRAVADSKRSSNLRVDLSGMTFVDDIGEEVLSWLKELGSTFTAGTAYSHDVCERLQLPLVS
jgi:hypothetical protein